MLRKASPYYSSMLTQQLLFGLAQQMKVPLVNIARRAEVAAAVPGEGELRSIRTTAEAALWLLDSYLLGLRLVGQDALTIETEPVSISGVLYDIAQQLQPFARAYGVELGLRVDGKFGLVMAHPRALHAAIVSLGYAMIEALPAQPDAQLELQLSAHRCRYGIVAGLYCQTEQVTSRMLQIGRELQGQARQPLSTLSHTSGAGIFVADAILHAMQTRLNVSRHRHLYGLGAVLPLNPQLQLV